MAKKARAPRPPVQAPKRRETKSGGLGSVPRWALVVGFLVLAGIVAAIAFGVAGGGGGGEGRDAEVATAMAAAGCRLRHVKPLPPRNSNYHGDAPNLETNTRWSTSPPSAGGHYPAWAIWGFHRAPVNPRQVVHNLEHGGVAIWWGPQVPAAMIDELEIFYRESPDGMIGTPFAGLGNKIALTTWTGDPSTYYRNGDHGIGHIAICPTFDEEAFVAFRDAYRGEGPEGIPTSSNKPGSGPQGG